MKKIFFMILMLFIPIMFVKANTISDITMDIYVDNNGNATITEKWYANVSSGTEGYHPYFNIGNSSIEIISASMDGNDYTVSNSWNINSSMSAKAYKAGIYHTGSEYDICFGLSSYGTHTYQVVYKITNFVLSTTDADMVYWTLFPYDFNATPKRVYIKIYSDFKYSDTLDVWGYGNYGGTAYVYDGYIELESPEGFNSSEYMTVLIKYPKGTFTTSNTTTNNFEYYYNMAEEGSSKYIKKEESTSLISKIISFIFYIIEICFPIFIMILIVGKSSNTKNYSFESIGNKVRKDVPNFRDIPCNKDLYRAYFVSSKYNLIKKKEDILGAILLKWIKDGNVKVEKYEKKKLFKTEILDNIVFVNNPNTNELESRLYNWMYIASKDGKLEADEFKKWCSSNYTKILKWFDEIIDYERDCLIQENKITVQSTDKKLFNKTLYVVDSSMMIEAEQMQGLKNFLKEFSMIQTKEPIEVHLWNEYLIYAQIFGMADEVAKQFKKLYPEIVEQMDSNGFNYNNIIFINHITTSGMSSARASQQRANSYSSGGGGFSSGGGGGGSFGGGGGGGGFR